MGFAERIADAAVAGPGLPSSRSSHRNQLAIEAILLVAVFAIFANFGPHSMTDGKYSMLVSENVIYHHRFSFDELSMPRRPPFARQGIQANGYPYQVEERNGKLLYVYPVGSSLLSIPFVVLMNIAGASAHNSEGGYFEAGDQYIQGMLAALLMAVMAVIFLRTALLLLPLTWSLVLTLGGVFSTQIWSTASRVLWSHTWQLLLIGLAIYLLLSAEEEQYVHRRTVLLATLLSWAYFVRPTSSIPIMGIGAYVILSRPKEFITLAVTGAAWLALFVVYSMVLSGQPLPSYYLFHLSSGKLWEGLAGNLVSPSRGLLLYVPSSAFVLALVAYYWRYIPHRGLAVLSIFIIVVHTLVISTDPNWWGGHCYGARLTIDAIPWFFLLAVLGCKRLLEEPSTRLKKSAVVLGILSLLLGAAINGRGALSQSANDWVNGPPADVDQMPSRIWDWSHPQFLSQRRNIPGFRIS